MPIPERYYKKLIEQHSEAERRARKDTRWEWFRVLLQIFIFTSLGLLGLGLALHTYDVDLAWVYWWGGTFVWVAGWCVAMITAYRRGVRRGDWK